MLFSIVDIPRFLLWNILTRSYAFASKLSMRYLSDLEVVFLFSRKYFLFWSIKSSYANVLVLSDPKERERLYWQSDHLRLFGLDYGEKLSDAGFHVREDRFIDELDPELVKRYALPKGESIYFCEKKNN